MTIEKQKIVEALRTVKDPATGQEIIRMRMVENLQVEGNNISFTLVLPSLNSPVKSQLHFACIGVIGELYPQAEVHVHMKAQSGGQRKSSSPVPHIRNIIAIGSGKGGVGKSTVAVNLALGLKKLGARVGLMDTDLYGPSIPTMLGLQGQRPKIQNDPYGQAKIIPIEKYGIPTLSIGYIIEKEAAVVLRGPRLGAIIQQFFRDCLWPDLDFLILDLPPGTGDIQLTLVQTVPITGAILVTTPQEVALADAIKAMNMFQLPNIGVPILGVVENMAWFTPKELPKNKYYLFGKNGGKKLAKLAQSMLLGQVPIVQEIREAGDKGKPAVLGDEPIIAKAFEKITKNVARQTAIRNEMLAPTQVVHMNNSPS